MAFLRPLSLAAAVSLVACGSSSTAPQGTHYHYVTSRLLVPSQAGQTQQFGLDLNGDGSPDNALGTLLSSLSAEGINPQTSVDEAVFNGSILLLADFQTTDFTNAGASGLQLFLGSDAMPAACGSGETVMCGSGAGATCTGCQHDLTGDASFSIAPDSPMDVALEGHVTGGTFTGGPGNLSLEISLGGSAPTQVNLIGARVKATGITATAIGTESDDSSGMILGGAITATDLMTNVIPSIIPVIQGVLTNHCPGAVPGNCMCDATGKAVLSLFDTPPTGNNDCMVSATEITTSTFGKELLAPDVTINGMAAISLGVKAYAVGATFTVDGEGSAM